ncbi:hypothetical protein GOODEAATRI_001797 [Goodea atripinnis]|uniref:Uncharacterized protein n=1 Tax=Goodea atripinnis TaxID=208336 RepID=A0ABV0PAL8_9TELE
MLPPNYSGNTDKKANSLENYSGSKKRLLHYFVLLISGKIYSRNSQNTFSKDLVLCFLLPTNVADTTNLSTTLASPHFHQRATGAPIFLKQLTRSELRWQHPTLKWLP